MTNIETQHSEMVTLLAKPGKTILEQMLANEAHMLHMVLGIAGEAGELIDAIKKHVMYRKVLDRGNVIEELGDIEFYMEGLRQSLQITREETLDHNYDKLMKKRYPNGYTDAAAINRADKALESTHSGEPLFGEVPGSLSDA
jgi:NTP pyrophosphatase (non-canonical NTP hydrolase)